MELFEAIQIAEGDIECGEQQWLQAWQWLIDEGHVWKLQGWYGRMAADLIENSICTPPNKKKSKKGF